MKMKVLGFVVVAFSSLCHTTGAFSPTTTVGVLLLRGQRQNNNKPRLFSTVVDNIVEEEEKIQEANDWLSKEFEQVDPSSKIIIGSSDNKRISEEEDHDWFPYALLNTATTLKKGLQIFNDDKTVLSQSAFEGVVAVPSSAVVPTAPAFESLSSYHAQPAAAVESPPAIIHHSEDRGQVEWFSQMSPKFVVENALHNHLDATGGNEWFMQAIQK